MALAQDVHEITINAMSVAMTVERTDPASLVEEPKIEEKLDDPDEPELLITFTLALTAGLLDGTINGHEVSGENVTAAIGYRLDKSKSIGGRISVGSVSGTYLPPFSPTMDTVTANPLSVGIFFQVTLLDRLHGAAFVGYDFNSVKEKSDPAWQTRLETGISGGLELGLDVLRWRGHRLMLFGRIEEEVGSFTDYGATSLGVGYRYF